MSVVPLLGQRLSHLLALPFSAWTMLGLALALVCWVVLRRLPTSAARERWLAGASLLAVALATSAWLALAWLAFALTFRTATEAPWPSGLRWLAVGALLATGVLVPIIAIPWLAAQPGHAHALTAFASNVALLRFWAYAVDRHRRRVPVAPLRRYLVATFFFPTFVNGPVEAARALPESWPVPTRRDLAIGLRRVLLGSLLMVAVVLLFPAGWTSVLTEGPTAPAGRLWSWAAALWVWFFLSFAAWSEVAIGLGRLCGRTVQENFDHPWRALGVADFWRRWHISLGLWLRDYVYIPLGGGRARRVRNVLVVFAVSAAWHVWGTTKLVGLGFYPPRAWGGLALWGLVHTLAVAFAPRPRADPTGLWRLATFAFVSWAWIPFFLPASVPPAAGVRMLLRMLLPWW